MDIEKVVLLILGWLFGLLSPLIVDAIRKQWRHYEIVRAIVTELQGFRFVIAATALRLARDLGGIDRALLELLLPASKLGAGPYENELPLASAIEKALSATDQDFKTAQAVAGKTQWYVDAGGLAPGDNGKQKTDMILYTR